MKKLTGAICIALCTLSGFSQKNRILLDSAKALSERGQYLSAFRKLEESEEAGADIIVAAASLINNHQNGFTTNLDQWQLEDRVNGKLVAGQFVKLPLENILWSAAAQFPSDCRIHKEIYNLYVTVLKIRGDYLEVAQMSELAQAMEKQLLPQCPDYRNNYITGYCNIVAGNIQAAINNLQKAIAGNTQFAPAHLQLGKAYLLTNNLPGALKELKTAFELSGERLDKSKAALLTGQAYEAANDNSKALSSYLVADSIHRKEFFNQQALLNFYVKNNDARAPQALKSFIGAQGRESLHIYLDALDIYQKYNRTMDLALYCQKVLADYKGYPDIESSLNFTLGIIYRTINADMARQYFKKAKELGVNAQKYPPTRNHPFTAKRIEEGYKWAG